MKHKENIKFTFKLENQKISTRYYVLFILLGVVFLALSVYLIAINQMIALIINVLIALVGLFIFNLIKPTYFNLKVYDNYFEVNHYSIASIVRDYQNIRIDFQEFNNFQIESKFWGLHKKIIFSVKTRHGVADYPGISISIFSKAEMAQMLIILNKLVVQNN